jgi:hypothetical protein
MRSQEPLDNPALRLFNDVAAATTMNRFGLRCDADGDDDDDKDGGDDDDDDDDDDDIGDDNDDVVVIITSASPPPHCNCCCSVRSLLQDVPALRAWAVASSPFVILEHPPSLPPSTDVDEHASHSLSKRSHVTLTAPNR